MTDMTAEEVHRGWDEDRAELCKRIKELEAKLQNQSELIDWAMRQVKECQVHFAMTGEGTTALFETGRNVICMHRRM